jgi:hypothetical protein
MQRDWIALPNSSDAAEALVSTLMPASVKFFSCARYRGHDYAFWGVSVHTSDVVASACGDTIGDAFTKCVQEFWEKMGDAT